MINLFLQLLVISVLSVFHVLGALILISLKLAQSHAFFLGIFLRNMAILL